jgi:hypothetical protein
MFAYSMTFDQCGIEPWIAHWRCDQAAPPLESLIGLGVDTQPRSSTYRVSTPCPCGHKAASGGRSLVSTLLRRATSLGVEVRTGVRVEWLRTEDERVTGVRSGAGEIEAGAVILASGGLGPNTELLRELYPAAASGIEPRLLQRLSFDTAHTPVAHGEAVSVVGESAVPGLPAGLVWRRPGRNHRDPSADPRPARAARRRAAAAGSYPTQPAPAVGSAHPARPRATPSYRWETRGMRVCVSLDRDRVTPRPNPDPLSTGRVTSSSLLRRGRTPHRDGRLSHHVRRGTARLTGPGRQQSGRRAHRADPGRRCAPLATGLYGRVISILWWSAPGGVLACPMTARMEIRHYPLSGPSSAT